MWSYKLPDNEHLPLPKRKNVRPPVLSQMASIIKLLSLTLFLGLIFEANGQCFLSNISIAQTKTGEWAHGKPEWSVTVNNNCACSQSQVKLNCAGFQTYKTEDPSILSISGDECLLNSGNPIGPYGTLKFQYAWDPQFAFQPISSQISCS